MVPVLYGECMQVSLAFQGMLGPGGFPLPDVRHEGNPGRLALGVGRTTFPATPLDWDGYGELVSNTAPTEEVDCRVVWPAAPSVRMVVL